ncbi:putative transmembrane protein [Gregarina niphandrodes]|uniref:Transmembrane protein n=1 Tax=Gregarina niphandrodes TaxID=110365 RepID=A0A023AXI7_GRENI|nr:putative transmembrane protein [Gregarina niphandrodes]EZG43357.1 putative transmembrane protein [Gregarina niphandrodes]|eukprot:XP_011134666.1 putative transmembrane protein [Gregarina niphandrodes]
MRTLESAPSRKRRGLFAVVVSGGELGGAEGVEMTELSVALRSWETPNEEVFWDEGAELEWGAEALELEKSSGRSLARVDGGKKPSGRDHELAEGKLKRLCKGMTFVGLAFGLVTTGYLVAAVFATPEMGHPTEVCTQWGNKTGNFTFTIQTLPDVCHGGSGGLVCAHDAVDMRMGCHVFGDRHAMLSLWKRLTKRPDVIGCQIYCGKLLNVATHPTYQHSDESFNDLAREVAREVFPRLRDPDCSFQRLGTPNSSQPEEDVSERLKLQDCFCEFASASCQTSADGVEYAESTQAFRTRVLDLLNEHNQGNCTYLCYKAPHR